ncbi:cobyrinate a,c-diamide synthase [Microlunatus soli]|uniref:cobyrinate a,c-diamide synthase n=1 Tax=Microlunatus soli TaxID=630515 RepID=UPI0018D41FD0|nr:cobyrinate a,c-diamide synthase [Microlunatus soli]
MVQAGPRVVIAAPGSGQGKTTVATGLMAALRAAGDRVAGFKIGPDYIDPGYHALATGRPGRNLDPRLCSPEAILPLFLHGMAVPDRADLAVVEGVMGLYDGQLGTPGFASTAHVAGLLGAPVIIVLDVSGLSRTAGAIVAGLAAADPELQIGGVILNKAGSDRHRAEVAAALAEQGFPVLGSVPRDAGIAVPSRHLGLIPAAERGEAADAVARLAELLAGMVDLDAIREVARRAPGLRGAPWDPAAAIGAHPTAATDSAAPVVAVAGGRAFTFHYPETEELLRAAGCRPVIFDPVTDQRLPDGTAGLYLGGGFPELHAADLAGNDRLRQHIADAIASGLPTVAECAGLLYLCRSCDGAPMVGALPVDAGMTERLRLGYRTAVADHDQLLSPAGGTVVGHEFHRTAVLSDAPAGASAGWQIDDRPEGYSLDPSGSGRPTLHASYLHLHWAGQPQVARRFADAVHSYARRVPQPAGGVIAPPSIAQHSKESRRRTDPPDHDLDHHGDREIADGLTDLAVNVRLDRPPSWLAEILRGSVDALAGYPRPERAIAAIAAAHGVTAEQVLPTAGGAEAFTLIARGVAGDRPVVVHPQFTEPEAALRTAGRVPRRVITDQADGFALDPAAVPDDADLIMIGNPTNPTSVLHPADRIRRLVGPGRVVCVDEAFMDAVPGERESLIGGDLTGIVVLRSLTKTWGLAGLRAGYAVGDPTIIAAMRAQQPPWSVSVPAIDATVACLSESARAEAARAAVDFEPRRRLLIVGLERVGLTVVQPATAPFVLVRGPVGLRSRLRDHGIVVRRGDTFPGLDASWIRVAVRDPETTDQLIKTLTNPDLMSFGPEPGGQR